MKKIDNLKYLLTTEDCYQQALRDLNHDQYDDGTEPPIYLPAVVVFDIMHSRDSDVKNILFETYVYLKDFEE